MAEEGKYPQPPEPATTAYGMHGGDAVEMPMYKATLAEAQQLGTVGVSALAHRPTITEMLQAKRDALAKELEYVDKALEQMRIQRDTAILLDSIAKAQVGTRY